MTAPRRIPLSGLSAGERRLEGDTAHYLARVLRLRAGDAFVAFDPAAGLQADATMLASRGAGGAVDVRLGPPRAGVPPPERSLTWVQALPKGQKCDAIVRDATELGVTHFVAAAARRSVARLDPARAADRAARWSRVAREAARQCGRGVAPRIDVLCDWQEALSCIGEGCDRFCLWEGATQPLGPLLFASIERRSALAFACGPEGGFEGDEVALALRLGWAVVSLGPRLLRAETVAAAVLGAVQVASFE